MKVREKNVILEELRRKVDEKCRDYNQREVRPKIQPTVDTRLPDEWYGRKNLNCQSWGGEAVQTALKNGKFRFAKNQAEIRKFGGLTNYHMWAEAHNTKIKRQNEKLNEKAKAYAEKLEKALDELRLEIELSNKDAMDVLKDALERLEKL